MFQLCPSSKPQDVCTSRQLKAVHINQTHSAHSTTIPLPGSATIFLKLNDRATKRRFTSFNNTAAAPHVEDYSGEGVFRNLGDGAAVSIFSTRSRLSYTGGTWQDVRGVVSERGGIGGAEEKCDGEVSGRRNGLGNGIRCTSANVAKQREGDGPEVYIRGKQPSELLCRQFGTSKRDVWARRWRKTASSMQHQQEQEEQEPEKSPRWFELTYRRTNMVAASWAFSPGFPYTTV